MAVRADEDGWGLRGLGLEELLSVVLEGKAGVLTVFVGERESCLEFIGALTHVS